MITLEGKSIYWKYILHIYRGIAQLVEQRSPKPRAEGSSPSAPAKFFRGVAQFGSASALGAEGRRFESCHPDHEAGPLAQSVRASGS